ncbi:MAG TPA: hypothetical protein VF243_04030 [Nitrosospira sp.]
MKVNRMGLFWGLLLIGAGVVALGQQLGYIQQFTDPQFWIWVFALISLAAVVEYGLSGWKQWGWLFPAGAFGGVALVITLAINGVESAAVASPIFIGMLIPFAAAYLTDRTRNWWALIPGGVMLFLAVTMLIVDSAGGEWVGAMLLLMFALAFLMAGLAATFAVLWLRHHKDWARIVTVILAILSVASVFFFGYYEIFWPFAFICGGIYLLYLALRPKAV